MLREKKKTQNILAEQLKKKNMAIMIKIIIHHPRHSYTTIGIIFYPILQGLRSSPPSSPSNRSNRNCESSFADRIFFSNCPVSEIYPNFFSVS